MGDSKDDDTSSIENIGRFPIYLQVEENKSVVEASIESTKVMKSKVIEKEAEESIDVADSRSSENLHVEENQSVEASSFESTKFMKSTVFEKQGDARIDADDSKLSENLHVEENQSVVEASFESTKLIKSTVCEKQGDAEIDADDSKLSENGSEEVESQLSSTASEKKDTTGNDPINESLSLPYFSLPKPSYVEYTNQVGGAKNLKTPSLCAKSPDSMRRNYELPPNNSKSEEIGNETNEKIFAAERSPSMYLDNENKVKPNNCPDEAMARFKSSLDNDAIVDGPSPHGSLKRFKERCLHATTSKRAKKPNLNFSGEIGVKKPVGLQFEKTETENVSDGLKREVLQSDTLDENKKKEDALKNNKQKNENFEVIEQKNKVIEQKNEVIEQKNEVNEQKNQVIEQKKEVIEQKNKDFVVIDLTDDSEVGDLDSEITEDDRNFDSMSSREYDGDDEYSDSLDSEDFEKSTHLSYLSTLSLYNERLNGTEETFVELSDYSIIENNFFNSSISFSMPSRQPDGGFANPSVQYIPASVLRSHLNSNNHYYSIDQNSIPSEVPYEVITISSNSDNQNVASDVDSKPGIPLSEIPFMNPGNILYKVDRFEDNLVSQTCSEALPSTNSLPSTPCTSSQSCSSSKIVVNKSSKRGSLHEKMLDKSFDASCQDFKEASRCLSVKRRRVTLKSLENEDNCKKPDISEVENSKPVIQDKDPAVHHHAEKKIIAQSVIDEAELSRKEKSSDEYEVGLDAIKNEENYEELPDDEILKDQIGQMHLKHMQDNEGEHAESHQCEKKFSWTNKDLISEATHTHTRITNSSDSVEDNAEMFNPLEHQGKLKWMKEESAKDMANEPSQALSTKDVNLEVDIIGKSNVPVSDQKIDSSLKRKSGSLLNSEGLKAKRSKEEAAIGVRKQVFVKNDQEIPVPSTSTEQGKGG